MYEQDYIMRLNREVIRTIIKLLFNKDTEPTLNIVSHELKTEDKKMLDSVCGQVDLGNISQAENDLQQRLAAKEEHALEKLLLFYIYLNAKSDEFLLENNYSHEKLRDGLKELASQAGILDLVNLLYTI